MPTIDCPRCSASLRLPSGLSGRASCPRCKETITVPERDGPPAEGGAARAARWLRLALWLVLGAWAVSVVVFQVAAQAAKAANPFEAAFMPLLSPAAVNSALWLVPPYIFVRSADEALRAGTGGR